MSNEHFDIQEGKMYMDTRVLYEPIKELDKTSNYNAILDFALKLKTLLIFETVSTIFNNIINGHRPPFDIIDQNFESLYLYKIGHSINEEHIPNWTQYALNEKREIESIVNKEVTDLRKKSRPGFSDYSKW